MSANNDWENLNHHEVEPAGMRIFSLRLVFLLVGLAFAAGLEWQFGSPTQKDWEVLGFFFLVLLSWNLIASGFDDAETRLKRIEHRLIAVQDQLCNAREDISSIKDALSDVQAEIADRP